MSRKNLFADVTPPAPAPVEPASPAAQPAAHVGRMFADIRERARRVETVERSLADADRIIEIDPAAIDPSPIRDRLAGDDDSLVESIAANGQQVPGLVRPHPSIEGRYLAVFGHRRLAAARKLGILFKAVVADFSDEQAYVAQGVENSERRDLSFIERALFAKRLADASTPMRAISAALGSARPNIVVMIGLARRIPEDLIIAIGSSLTLGQNRWQALDDLLKRHDDEQPGGAETVWRKAIKDPDFQTRDAPARFAAVTAALESAGASHTAPRQTIADASGAAFATLRRKSSGSVSIDFPKATNTPRADGVRFDEWVAARLAALREEWRSGG
ncbi:plasmid partitioning protein RepB [Methylocystis sp. IM4]|uniref:plasmid partitioning protein RepB n=1 Tax=Methylocystis sp. IM4 TaxID=3136560 RepID=UPI00311962CC